ncbi:MAG: PI-PLC domain-containing protein [Daejeonella sp.]
MTSLIKVWSIILFFFVLPNAEAQPKRYTTANAHSHNDYLNSTPFFRAYNNGFASIEADVFPVNGKLLTAHSKREIKPENTLKALYLDPIAAELPLNLSRRLKLLIDIKENYKESLSLLLKEIQPIQQYLSTPDEIRFLTILITGNRPLPSEYKNYPAYIFFDDDLKLLHNASEWERVGLVSLYFGKFSAWKGEGKPQKKDITKLKHTIDSVHQTGKTIRFWAAPDNARSWQIQKKLGVDLIGTDHIDELGNFLRPR